MNTIITSIFLIIISINVFTFTPSVQNKYSDCPDNFLDTNENTVVKNPVTINEAISYAEGFLEGEVIYAEKKFVRDKAIWKILQATKQKGIIKYEVAGDELCLLRIESDEGPFEYELILNKKHVSFSSAKNKAESLTGQKILKWFYTKNKESWEYGFWLFTKSGKAQVKIDAESGEVISKKKAL